MRAHTIRVVRGDEVYVVRVIPSKAKGGHCETCGRPTRRNCYGILHDDCSRCRYLKMVYGPNIGVTP